MTAPLGLMCGVHKSQHIHCPVLWSRIRAISNLTYGLHRTLIHLLGLVSYCIQPASLQSIFSIALLASLVVSWSLPSLRILFLGPFSFSVLHFEAPAIPFALPVLPTPAGRSSRSLFPASVVFRVPRLCLLPLDVCFSPVLSTVLVPHRASIFSPSRLPFVLHPPLSTCPPFHPPFFRLLSGFPFPSVARLACVVTCRSARARLSPRLGPLLSSCPSRSRVRGAHPTSSTALLRAVPPHFRTSLSALVPFSIPPLDPLRPLLSVICSTFTRCPIFTTFLPSDVRFLLASVALVSVSCLTFAEAFLGVR